MKVYSKPACVQCDATYRMLDKLGAEYEVINIEKDPEAAAFAQSLGYLQAPVVVTATGEHWSGYKPDHLKAHATIPAA